MAGTVLLKCACVAKSWRGCVGVCIGRDELGGRENAFAPAPALGVPYELWFELCWW